jgi:fused signal recognition particle receptor
MWRWRLRHRPRCWRLKCLEASVVVDDLPVAADPVLPEEMDTAGGPAGDVDEVAAEAAAEDDVSEILPAALATGEVGLVPLSLLEAEAAAEAVADAATTPPSVQGYLPQTAGDQLEGAAADTTNAVEEIVDAADVAEAKPAIISTEEAEQEVNAQPISPPVGEMPGRAEGGAAPAAREASETSAKTIDTPSPSLTPPPSSPRASPPARRYPNPSPSSRHRSSPGSSACGRALPAPRRS